MVAFDLTRGIVAAPITPFNEDESVDWTTLESYVGSVAGGGPAGIAMNMAAGEGASLEREEQLEALRRTKAVVAGSCPVLSGLVASHTRQAVRVARELVDAGADALVVFPVLPAFVSKPVSSAMVFDYHAAIAEAVSVPIIAFNTAIADYPAGTIAGFARIDSLVAVKDAAFNIDRTAELIEEARTASRPISILTGNDTFILEALLLGNEGALIGFAGTATAELVRMHNLVVDRKISEAYEIWDQLGHLARFCWTPPLRDYRVRMKYVLHRQGVIPSVTARRPQPAITERDRQMIDRLFDQYGYADGVYLPSGSRPVRLRSVS